MAGFPFSSLHNNNPPANISGACRHSEHGEVGSSGYIENNFNKTKLVSWKPPLKFT